MQDIYCSNNPSLSKDEIQTIFLNCTAFLVELGSKNDINQRVVYSAIIYFRRFYSKIGFYEVHPYLAVPTCFYLAGKIEEIGISVTRVLSFLESVCKSHKIAPLQWTVEEVLCCENCLLQTMDFCLLLHHPVRPLRHILSVLHCEEYLQTCLNIINDCYFTTIPLLYPPHLIAATTIYMMCIYNSIDPQKVFEQMGIEMSMVKAICAHICGFYDSGEELWPGSISDTILSLSSQFHRE